MSKQMDHERCSELLPAFLRRELPAEKQASVETHLSGCARCSAEASALRSLYSLEGAELTGSESERLRAAVTAIIDRSELDSEPSPVVALPARRGGRLLPVLGAAAVIAVAVIFAANLFSGTSFLGDEAGEGAGAIRDAEVAEIRQHLQFRGAPRRTTAERSALSFGRAGEDSTATNEDAAPEGRGGAGGDVGEQAPAPAAKARARPLPRPFFVRSPGRLTDRRLALVGRYGLPLVLLPRAYNAADAGSLQEGFLQQLANAAPTEPEGEQILACGAPILARPQPALPALATFGEKDGRTVLVLAFAWAEDASGRLDRYMVWTWPAGDCDAIPDYRAGFIKA